MIESIRFRLIIGCWLLAVLEPAFHAHAQRARHSGLDRDRLLQYHSTDGAVRDVTDLRQWQRRRREIVKAMESLMGPLPTPDRRLPLEVRIDEDVDCGSYVRRHITYQSEAGSRVPAYLLIPKRATEANRVPAVLCLHPTDDRVGNKVVVGLGGRANRQYGAELAERGYVTIAPAYPLLADYQPDWRKLGYQSGTMKAIWDNIRAIDLLAELPFVDESKIGAIGHSLGGHNSVYTAVFEPRIRVVVTSCGLDRYRDYKGGDIRGWTSDRYMPKLLEFRERLDEIPVDFPEIVAAVAPRPLLIVAPLHDTNFGWKSVDRIASSAKPVYRLYQAEVKLRVEHPDCPHDFPPEMRQLAYRWIDLALRVDGDSASRPASRRRHDREEEK